jgi:LL-diaminopimelate aminotransferase
VDLDPGSECLALIGSKEGIAHLPFAFVDRGDCTLVPDPGYPVYSTATMFAGGVVHKMPLLKENGFLPDLDAIDKSILNKTKIMFINYPNNPTSAIATKDFYNRVVELALKYGFLVASDNAYSEIYYDNYKPMSFLEIDGAKEVAIELHSFSKTFNMTGWRIGFAVGNKEGIYGLGKIKTNVDSGVFTALQQAGIYALNNYKVLNEPIRKIFQERKDQMSLALKKANFDFEEPLATFYFWVKVPDGYNSKDFAKKLLEEKGIVVTPGVGFGEYGEGYFRISITNPNIQKAVDAIKSL